MADLMDSLPKMLRILIMEYCLPNGFDKMIHDYEEDKITNLPSNPGTHHTLIFLVFKIE